MAENHGSHPGPSIASPMAPDSAPESADDDEADNCSLSESAFEYPEVWGRTYHKFREGSYKYPNDDVEQDRMNLFHHVLRRLHNDKLFFAPIANPRLVLDVGTGTGIWPIELADAKVFPPATKIIGTDLSPIQPNEVPPGVFFQVDDCSESDWGGKEGSMDFIHVRQMLGSLESYPRLIKTARKYVRPGTGWLECQELLAIPVCDDGTIPPDWPLLEWTRLHNDACSNLNPPRPIRIADKLEDWMNAAGFLDVRVRVDYLPIGPWPRDKRLKAIGKSFLEVWENGLSAFSYMTFHEGLGWSRNQIEAYLASVRSSARDPLVHSYMKFYVVYGRRPSAEEEKRLFKTPTMASSVASGSKAKPGASKSGARR